ncbi:MAG: hypothetical protein JXB10_12840 [Pirellulales bacterium]|nr:hypothetical protein [Pirellulales bacterium]
MSYPRNPALKNRMLPVEIVLGPPWWHHHEKISFDRDHFYHPARRVEDERKMEDVLYQRWGRYGLGAAHGQDVPVVGAVHLAAGYLISEMLGCAVEYVEDGPPLVRPLGLKEPVLRPESAWESPAFKRTLTLFDALKTKYSRLTGDINWSGVLNLALDLRGEAVFLDMLDRPGDVQTFLGQIASVIERFTQVLSQATNSTSVSVNRLVRHLEGKVFLHSECSNVMLSTADYEKYFFDIDAQWSRKYRPFGIHYCGKDPHRYAPVYAKLPYLDFFDVGWGGDVAEIRKHLPGTFLNLRLSPVEIVGQTPEEIRATIRRLVLASANPYLTGVCCINMDQNVRDEQITAILDEVEALRNEYAEQERKEMRDQG